MFIKSKNVWVIFAVLIVLWMAVIFSFSIHTAKESSSVSQSVTEKIIEFVNPSVTKLNETERQQIVDRAEGLVRKMAHALNYAILGFLCAMMVVTSKKVEQNFKGALLSLAICSLYAASDEFHQTLVPGRSGEVRDVVIDTIGSAVAIALVYGVYKIVCKRKSKRQ